MNFREYIASLDISRTMYFYYRNLGVPEPMSHVPQGRGEKGPTSKLVGGSDSKGAG